MREHDVGAELGGAGPGRDDQLTQQWLTGHPENGQDSAAGCWRCWAIAERYIRSAAA